MTDTTRFREAIGTLQRQADANNEALYVRLADGSCLSIVQEATKLADDLDRLTTPHAIGSAGTVIEFAVIGQQATQGSKKVVPIFNKAGPVMVGGRPLTRAVEDNPRTAEWRQEVAHAARQVVGADAPLIGGPIALRLEFVRPRPKEHWGTGRNKDRLKPSAPKWPTGKPDLTKLTRAVEDALKGVIWCDDSQVVRQEIAKDWGEYFCVKVTIEELGEPITKRTIDGTGSRSRNL